MVSVGQELSKTGSSEISIFIKSTQASPGQIVATIQKLSVAFPNMKKEFFDLLAEQIDKTEMPSKQLEYALNTVLNTFKYKHINISDILNVDIKCKVYSYIEMCNEMQKNSCDMSYYAPIRIGYSERVSWVTRADKEKYSLPDDI